MLKTDELLINAMTFATGWWLLVSSCWLVCFPFLDFQDLNDELKIVQEYILSNVSQSP